MQRLLNVFILLACLGALSIPARSGDAIPWRFESPERIVAIGDLHGDLNAARRALRLAGAIDENDQWIGGGLVVVQTGDQLDRGDQERAVMDLLARLERDAARVGGAVHVLNGNHELMNAQQDLRYVTEGGFQDFQGTADVPEDDAMLSAYVDGQRARVAAFRPGGPYARQMARRNAVVVIGETVFVHGGVLPEHLDYGLERLNAELQAWMAGDGPEPEWVTKKESVVWTRRFSDEVDRDSCELLKRVLEQLGAARMVVGHTIHDDITSHCGDRVWCIDTGMSAYYGGKVQVLEIKGDVVTVLYAK